MKTVGLLGGMSWESTIPYYRIINQVVGERLGGLHSARLILYSVDFHEIEALQQSRDWDEAGRRLADAASALRAAGADFAVLCTNTMHRVAESVEAAGLPLFHIADATGVAIRAAGFSRVGLIGTRFTMEEDFYRGRLSERHGIATLVPGEADRERLHRVIYDELCRGIVREASRQDFKRILADLVQAGAQGVVLGCTEIMLLIGQDDSSVPVFDTTTIHARGAALLALEQ